MSSTDPEQHLFWLASRALGIVAIVLLAFSVTLGLGLSGRFSRRPGLPARLKHLHEAVALATLGAIAGHALFLLGDTYLRPGVAGIALPFVLRVKPLWTGIGIIAGWLAAIVGLSFYTRRWIGVQTWRWIHRWTLGVYALALVHILGSGTDAASAWFIAVLAVITGPPALLLFLRLMPAPRSAIKASG
jgi:sulfoxide reductase heme-binding subunit YedZ